MSFVGTRPEAVKYVEKYKPEYMATLLLPAGITSEASGYFWVGAAYAINRIAGARGREVNEVRITGKRGCERILFERKV